MDRSDFGSVLDSSITSRADQLKKAWGLRMCVEDAKERPVASRRIKTRDLQSLLRSEGIRTSKLESITESMERGLDIEDDEAHQIEEANSSLLSDTFVPQKHEHNPPPLEQDPAEFSSDHAGSVQSPVKLGSDAMPIHDKDIRESCSSRSPDKISHPVTSIDLGVALNVVDVPISVAKNPFHPYKKLVQVKSAESSECGSTTGSLDEDEPLKRWKMMKQNGFLSLPSSHGGIPLPKNHGRQSRKRKFNEVKRKKVTPKKEQANKFAKLAPPSGLLSRLDPGIIKRVRNRKHVRDIIEAMLQFEKSDSKNNIHNKFTGELGVAGSNETNGSGKDHNPSQLTVPLSQPYVPLVSGKHNLNEPNDAGKGFHNETSSSVLQFSSDYDEGTCSFRLSPALTIGSHKASNALGLNFSANQESNMALSLKAATVASQWLVLLQLDIKGRLAALRRSKKRVRNVIQIELPQILTRELSLNIEGEPCSDSSCSTKGASNKHVTRWGFLFSQMDETLYEESKHLESWLSQVQEIHSHCESSLNVARAKALSDGSRSLRKLDTECAVMAAAASIYSTCSLVMTKAKLI